MPIFIPLFLKIKKFPDFSRSRSIHSHLLIEIQFDSIELSPQPLNSHFFFKNREAQNPPPFVPGITRSHSSLHAKNPAIDPPRHTLDCPLDQKKKKPSATNSNSLLCVRVGSPLAEKRGGNRGPRRRGSR